MGETAGLRWETRPFVGASHKVTRRLLVMDHSKIETKTWPQFRTASVLIGARVRVEYTMSYANLVRLHDSIGAAIAELDRQ